MRAAWLLNLLASLLVVPSVAAQCPQIRAEGVRAAWQACADLPPGGACSASEGTQLLGPLTSLTTPMGDLAFMNIPLRVPENAPPASAALHLLGAASLTRDSADDLPAWTAFSLAQTGRFCNEPGYPAGVLLQTPLEPPTPFQVNGIRLALSGTAFLTLDEQNTLMLYLVEGGAEVVGGPRLAAGTVWAGGPAMPYEAAIVRHLPLESLPRIPRVPLAGAVTLTETSPLWSAPDEDSAQAAFELESGAVLSVFGADLTGAWRHVRTIEGLEGWVPQGALSGNPTGTLLAYNATPQPQTRPPGPRYTEANTGRGAVRLRTAPNDGAPTQTQLPADVVLGVYGRSVDAGWLYVQLDTPLEGATDGWVFVPVVDLPEGFRVGDLPIWPEE